MNDHITDLIDIFLDGEVDSREVEAIEAHIAVCSDCAKEIQRRRRLSVILQSHPRMREVKSDQQFAKEVIDRIKPHETSLPGESQGQDMAWIGFPLLLIAGLTFLQVVWVESRLVNFIPQVGEVFDSSQILMPFSFAIPSVINQLIRFLPGGSIWNWNWYTTIILSACLGILYISWLAGWWVKNQQRVNA